MKESVTFAQKRENKDLLIILAGGCLAYPRPDGVKVIPLPYMKDRDVMHYAVCS